MTKKVSLLVAFTIAVICGVKIANAWDKAANMKDAVMQLRSPSPGAETKALAPLVGTFRLDGTIPSKMIALDQAEMRSEGVHVGKWIMNGLFVEVDISDVARVDTHALPWSGRVILGWDYQDKVYRGVVVDSQGTMGMVEGKLDGKKLALDLVSNNTLAGKPFKYRLTFDLTNPDSIGFNSEVLDTNKAYVLMEKKTLKRVGPQ